MQEAFFFKIMLRKFRVFTTESSCKIGGYTFCEMYTLLNCKNVKGKPAKQCCFKIIVNSSQYRCRVILEVVWLNVCTQICGKYIYVANCCFCIKLYLILMCIF